MKSILYYLIIFTAVIGGGFYYYHDMAPCKKPILYDIGGFDGRFGISKNKFLTVTKEAETIWEKDGRSLFEYKAGAKFKINLVFDDRQEKTIEADRSKEEIEGTRTEYDSMVTIYRSMANSYEDDLAEFKSKMAVFEERLADYNTKVARANSGGGASSKDYKNLEEERKNIETEKIILDKERLSLNGRASELNSFGDKVNSAGKQLNINVNVHNQKFGEAREFDQGEYRGNEINVFQFDTTGDLRLVLAHELGHALGLEHVPNPESIMYYLMDEQDTKNPALSREDKEALTKLCTPHIPKLQELFNYSHIDRGQ